MVLILVDELVGECESANAILNRWVHLGNALVAASALVNQVPLRKYVWQQSAKQKTSTKPFLIFTNKQKYVAHFHTSKYGMNESKIKVKVAIPRQHEL